MNRFIVSLLLFISPILFFALVADFFISQNLRKIVKNPGEFEVWSDIYNESINCNLAIYGSSRAWVHIDPAIIDSVLKINSYNFGIDGHNFWMQYLRHLELIKYNPSPKYIVVSVDVFGLQKREDLYKSEQFLPYMLWNTNMFQFTFSYKGFTFYDYVFPLVRYYGRTEVIKESFSNLGNNISKKYRKKGFRGIDRVWTGEFEKAKSQMEKYYIDLDTSSVQLFETFLKEAANKKIKVILVYTPEYVEGQKFISNRKEIVDLYNKLAYKHQIPFINYSEDSICYDKTLFYNATHLNKKGSNKFSQILAKDLKPFLSL